MVSKRMAVRKNTEVQADTVDAVVEVNNEAATAVDDEGVDMNAVVEEDFVEEGEVVQEEVAVSLDELEIAPPKIITTEDLFNEKLQYVGEMMQGYMEAFIGNAEVPMADVVTASETFVKEFATKLSELRKLVTRPEKAQKVKEYPQQGKAKKIWDYLSQYAEQILSNPAFETAAKKALIGAGFSKATSINTEFSSWKAWMRVNHPEYFGDGGAE